MAHVTGRVHRIPQHFHSCPIIAAFAVSVARSLRNRNFIFQCEIKNSLNHRRKSPQPERPAEIMDGKQWHSGDLISATALGSWRTFCGCLARRKNFGNFRRIREFFLFNSIDSLMKRIDPPKIQVPRFVQVSSKCFSKAPHRTNEKRILLFWGASWSASH